MKYGKHTKLVNKLYKQGLKRKIKVSKRSLYEFILGKEIVKNNLISKKIR